MSEFLNGPSNNSKVSKIQEAPVLMTAVFSSSNLQDLLSQSQLITLFPIYLRKSKQSVKNYYPARCHHICPRACNDAQHHRSPVCVAITGPILCVPDSIHCCLHRDTVPAISPTVSCITMSMLCYYFPIHLKNTHSWLHFPPTVTAPFLSSP